MQFVDRLRHVYYDQIGPLVLRQIGPDRIDQRSIRQSPPGQKQPVLGFRSCLVQCPLRSSRTDQVPWTWRGHVDDALFQVLAGSRRRTIRNTVVVRLVNLGSSRGGNDKGAPTANFLPCGVMQPSVPPTVAKSTGVTACGVEILVGAPSDQGRSRRGKPFSSMSKPGTSSCDLTRNPGRSVCEKTLNIWVISAKGANTSRPKY